MPPTAQISVIVPVFNGKQTIKRALDSVFAQTFSSLEVIVVDDASTDGTIALLARYAGERLSIISLPENRGAAAARNKGVAAAKGRWIAFLDSDDAWMPDKLARQIELLESSAKPVAACATGYIIEKNSRRFAVELNLTPLSFHQDIIFGCTISPGSTLVVERYVFDEIGGFDEKFRRLEDWDWLLRFSERYDMEFVPAQLAEIFLTCKKSPSTASNGDPTLDGIRRMNMKHRARFASLGKRLQFKGSLLIESAASLHRSDRPLAAAFYVVAALVIFPARNVAFFKSLWRAAKERIRRS